MLCLFGVLNAVACTISSNWAWERTPTGKTGRGRKPRFEWLGTQPMIIHLPPSWGDEMDNVVQCDTQWGEGWAEPDVAVCEARPARRVWLLPCRGCLYAQRRPDGHSASHLQHVFSGAAEGLCNHHDYIQHAQLLKHQTCYTNCYCKGAELGWESGSSHWASSSPSTQRRAQVLACQDLPSHQVNSVCLDCIFWAFTAIVNWTGVMHIYLL